MSPATYTHGFRGPGWKPPLHFYQWQEEEELMGRQTDLVHRVSRSWTGMAGQAWFSLLEWAV